MARGSRGKKKTPNRSGSGKNSGKYARRKAAERFIANNPSLTAGPGGQSRNVAQNPTQGTKAYPADTYGQRKRLREQQSSAPMAGGSPPSSNPPGAAAAAPAPSQDPAQPPPQSPAEQLFQSPSQRPQEPVTAGASEGPGPSPNPGTQTNTDDFLKAMYAVHPDPSFLELMAEYKQSFPNTNIGPPSPREQEVPRINMDDYLREDNNREQ